MAWIEVHQGILRHRKTIALAEFLNVHRTSAAGHIIGLWLWALDNCPEGDLTGLSPSSVALGAEWEGNAQSFVDAIIRSGFVDRYDNGEMHLHDWHDYAGRLIERRRADTERKRRQRGGPSVRGTSGGRPWDVRAGSGGPPQDVRQPSRGNGADSPRTEAGPSDGHPQPVRGESAATVPYPTAPSVSNETGAQERSFDGWTEELEGSDKQHVVLARFIESHWTPAERGGGKLPKFQTLCGNVGKLLNDGVGASALLSELSESAARETPPTHLLNYAASALRRKHSATGQRAAAGTAAGGGEEWPGMVVEDDGPAEPEPES